MICPNPNCKTENSSDAKFCRNCGKSLEVIPPPPPDDRSSGCLWIILIFFIVGVIGYFIYANINSNNYDDTDYIVDVDSCAIDTCEVVWVQEDSLSVSDDSLYFSASDYTKSITVYASSSFSISADLLSWGHTSIEGNTIKVWLDDNKSSSSRDDWFEITCEDLTERIYVYQEGDVLSQKATIQEIRVDHNVYDDCDQKGMKIHVKFETEDLKGIEGRVIANFFYDDETKIKDINNHYSTPDGQVCVSENFTPSYDSSTYNDFILFMPYSELHLNGSCSCYFSIIICKNNGEVVGSSDYNTYFKIHKGNYILFGIGID